MVQERVTVFRRFSGMISHAVVVTQPHKTGYPHLDSGPAVCLAGEAREPVLLSIRNKLAQVHGQLNYVL